MSGVTALVGRSYGRVVVVIVLRIEVRGRHGAYVSSVSRWGRRASLTIGEQYVYEWCMYC